MKRFALTCLAWVVAVAFLTPSAQALLVRGTGTGALIGGDLTDPENDGQPDANVGYNVVQFFADQEASFGGGEAAFNVFDNRVGGGNDKWCCGSNEGPFPNNVGFELATPHILNRFSITSGNDSPERDPRVWRIEGSQNGSDWIPIFNQQNTGSSVWTSGGNIRDQVIEYSAAMGDFNSTVPYSHFRFVVESTGALGGADFQLNELEFFGTPSTASIIPDVTNPGDFIIPIDRDAVSPGNGSSSPGGEQAGNAIDNNINTKYLNFGEENSGFIITPSNNPAGTAVTSLTVTTANDAVDRDPTSFELWGTNDPISSVAHSNGEGGELWTLIATGALNLPDARFAVGPTVTFANNTHWDSFKLLFPTVKNAGTANSMQLAEVQLNASVIQAIPEPATAMFGLLGLGALALRRRRAA